MADNGFKCPVCLEDFNNPRMLLPCTHTLCETPCLERLLQQARNRSLTCPVCRQEIKVPTNGVRGFPKNLYVGKDCPAGKVTFIESVGSGENTKIQFKVGDVTVLIYKKSLVDLRGLDAIVCPTNSDLDLNSGVAKVIANVAGSSVVNACKEHVRQNGRVSVGELFISTPGSFRCKGIVHVVGPEWSGYGNDVKNICAQDLYTTVVRILNAVVEKQWTSVGLCAIGSGQGGIPKQLGAEMYMKAILDSRHTTARNLNEIHFVDIDKEILTFAIKAHQEWTVNNDVLDFLNAHKYTS